VKKRFDWPFYRYVLILAVPIMLQNGITNFVGLLDNIMIGMIGTEQMSGVSIVNQLLFVVNLALFGATAGPGIFVSQFHGSGNVESQRQVFRFKLIACAIIVALGIAVLLVFDDPLISAWLHDAESGDLALTAASAREYLLIIVIGVIPFAVKEVYSSTLRETGQTVVPMVAAMTAVAVNLAFNYVLIFGKLGFPVLGVRGAAIATVISRFAECTVVMVWTHRHADSHSKYIRGVYRSCYINPQLAGSVLKKSIPLLANEVFWSLGQTMLSRCYSERGLHVVAAYNIASAVNNVASIVFLAMGTVTAIILGNLLGSGRTEEARKTAPRLILFGAVASGLMGIVQVLFADVFPGIYNTTEEVRSMAAALIFWFGLLQPLSAVAITEYYTLRSGGSVMVTLIFDSLFEWILTVPLAAALIFGTTMSPVAAYALVNASKVVKIAFGTYMVRRGKWVRNLAQQYQ